MFLDVFVSVCLSVCVLSDITQLLHFAGTVSASLKIQCQSVQDGCVYLCVSLCMCVCVCVGGG